MLGRRILTPFGGLCVFLLIAVLMMGGLGWVTRAALKVEAAEREATARADATSKERLALWQLDSRLFPTLAVENGRPYAQYFSLYIPHPVAIDDAGNLNNPGRVPSPLLSAELPEWMLLHFQLDPEKGWFSPQVLPENLTDRLQNQLGSEESLFNITQPRRRLLAELREKFDVLPTHQQFFTQEFADPSEGVLGVPVYSENYLSNSTNTGNTSRAKLPNPMSQQEHYQTNRGAVPPPNAAPPPEYQTADNRFRGSRAGESDLIDRKKAVERAAKEGQNTGAQGALSNAYPRSLSPNAPAALKELSPTEGSRGGAAKPPSPAATGPSLPGVPSPPPPGALGGGAASGAPRSMTAEKKKAEEPQKSNLLLKTAQDEERKDQKASSEIAGIPQVQDPVAGRRTIPGNRLGSPVEKAPVVQVGPMRPQWIFAEDGSSYLLLVRSARLETKTVFQGVVMDWTRLKEDLLDEVRPSFPQSDLYPVYDGEETTERQMASIPAKFDPGPVPPPEPHGWTPLRLGLALGWGAALIALAGIGFGGRALIDLNERRIRFVSAVTHELRTPLTSLRLYLDLLTSGMIEDPEKQKDYLRTLHGESDRLNRLIENVLDFARLEKRTVQTHIAPTKVDQLLESIRSTWADRCAADGKELVVIGTVPIDQMVQTDDRIATQILSNLIDNARKYSREADDPRIWVWAKPGIGKRIVLEVEDRGPGVPLAERASIFRPFRRGQSADTSAGGAGLGLALARQWAEMIGGKLSYRVADGGVGACFRLELPA